MLFTAGALIAEDSGGPWLFPKGWARGFVGFEMAPPHNEVDPGVCPPPDKDAPRCSAYARGILSGYLELQPFGRGVFQRAFIFAEPKVLGGNNVPQLSYSASVAPFMWERKFGFGVSLPRGFELRLTQHSNQLLGSAYHQPLPPLWRPDGPYGLYTTIGVRWYFGEGGRATGQGR